MKDTILFEKIGEAKLREVITDFYGRVIPDVMIGFMFQGKDPAHLIEREYELIAALLGAPGITYRGRPMKTAHAGHTIFGGHFERRMQILRETLRDHAVDAEVQDAWLGHSLALRHQVTRDKGSECATSVEATREPIVPVAPESRIKLGRKP